MPFAQTVGVIDKSGKVVNTVSRIDKFPDIPPRIPF